MYYFNSKKYFIGKFEDSCSIGIGEVGALACGDILKIFIKIIDDIICDAKVMIFGCVSAFAAATYLAEMLIGRDIYYALSVKNEEIANSLGLPSIKIHCSVLAQEALQKAICNYLQKNNRSISGFKGIGDSYFERKKTDAALSSSVSNNKESVIINSEQSKFTALNVSMSEIGMNFTSVAFYKIKKFFMDKPGQALFLYVEPYGCGHVYKYKIIKLNNIDIDSCIVNCGDFHLIFLHNQYSSLCDIDIDFLERNLESYMVFRKNKNVIYCYCGGAFNVSV